MEVKVGKCRGFAREVEEGGMHGVCKGGGRKEECTGFVRVGGGRRNARGL